MGHSSSRSWSAVQFGVNVSIAGLVNGSILCSPNILASTSCPVDSLRHLYCGRYCLNGIGFDFKGQAIGISSFRTPQHNPFLYLQQPWRLSLLILLLKRGAGEYCSPHKLVAGYNRYRVEPVTWSGWSLLNWEGIELWSGYIKPGAVKVRGGHP